MKFSHLFFGLVLFATPSLTFAQDSASDADTQALNARVAELEAVQNRCVDTMSILAPRLAGGQKFLETFQLQSLNPDDLIDIEKANDKPHAFAHNVMLVSWLRYQSAPDFTGFGPAPFGSETVRRLQLDMNEWELERQVKLEVPENKYCLNQSCADGLLGKYTKARIVSIYGLDPSFLPGAPSENPELRASSANVAALLQDACKPDQGGF